MRIEADSSDYHVLQNAVKQIKNVPGILCEIGTRRGGSLALIVNTLTTNEDHGRTVVFIDPYGNIEYQSHDTIKRRLDYTNKMRDETIEALYHHIQNIPVNLIPMLMEDTEFFKRFSDGVPVYNEYKTIENEYALVFFDGPHDVPSIQIEIDFFAPRSPGGAIWVFDDLDYYNHAIVEQRLFDMGWVLVEKTRKKASYRKQ
jgi:cephalosporin hydroxylase